MSNQYVYLDLQDAEKIVKRTRGEFKSRESRLSFFITETGMEVAEVGFDESGYPTTMLLRGDWTKAKQMLDWA